ncbi:DNA repair protein RadC [Roseivirga pacifica]|uniref:DNA repair protein RadC n=1 Tax=Roseivirga pacifica TaxID=1267423 RepID=A0A1I0MSB4_9BACT|nr:JAB domain-containing protein [Roseivirga pacifica]MCO6359159.1 DNA repair protein [Roseivirga pacifica]MCO6365205.1 DNA repair protein [Roseivirga pacifica]MCO6372065.1 DNA repair protein [Roseivirga pacifica]MCO6375824.1 DNA repair protein [Roseivirga pacifica]MCO6379443.1 DNA repair protein [Roseivirga pacifica]
MSKKNKFELSNKFEEVKLVYRNKTRASERPKIDCAESAYKILRAHWDDDQISLVEEAKVMFLDNQLRMMSIATVSKGGMSGTVIDLRIVFATALKRRSSTIILAHNHPSGLLRPSSADISLTRKFHEAGRILEITLADHLIVSEEGYYSMANEGLIH